MLLFSCGEKLRKGVFGTALFLLVLCAVLLLSPGAGFSKDSTPASGQTGVSPETVYILAIGCCPPWDPKQTTCDRNVEAFVQTFVSRGQVPAAQCRKIVDAQATYKGVVAGFKWLQQSTKETDTVIFYYNGHGDRLVGMNPDRDQGVEELFCLWSEKSPFCAEYAVWAKIWMTDKELASLLKKLRAKKRIVVLDTCHAGAGDRRLVKDGEPTSYGMEAEAVLAAAEANQFAMPTLDNKSSLFTFHLLREIRAGAADLKTAFERARPKIMAESKIVCARTQEKYPKIPCQNGQTPSLIDPFGITPLICFPGRD